MTISMVTGLVIFVLVVLFQLGYMIVTLVYSKKASSLDKSVEQEKITILIPAYNEEAVVANCLDGMLALDYRNYEAVFINDGSTDSTLDKLVELLDAEPVKGYKFEVLKHSLVKAVYHSRKYPNMILVDKVNGGKADSLNAGIAIATGDIVITLDADSVLKEDSLLHINERFLDKDVIAAGGMVQVGQMFKNGKPSYKGKGLVRYQLSEYLTSFYVRKFTQSKLNVIAIVSGAFGAFRRDVLFEIGGYKKSLGEDMEITLNIQKLINTKRNKSKMVFIPNAVCYTEVPENINDLFKQRIRWQKGFIDCIVRYRKDLFRALGFKFTAFLFWDSIAMATLGILTVVVLPLLVIFGELSVYHLMFIAISVGMQFSFRLIGHWASTRYNAPYSFMDYVRILAFFLVEVPIRPVVDSFIFLYGSLSYIFSRDKHNWNKVKRLGNVVVPKTSL